jgi:hypothetical protein
VLNKRQSEIRALEVEAETNETQAKHFADLAHYMSSADRKLKLEALAAKALEKLAAISNQVQRITADQERLRRTSQAVLLLAFRHVAHRAL